MDERQIESKDKAPAEGKKPYTPPALTVYGKLTELTASGSQEKGEGSGQGNVFKMA